MDRGQLQEWIDLYQRAWRSQGTALLSDLFSPTARYRTAPYARPFVGLDAIATMWEAERESPDEVFEMNSRIVALEGATGVAEIDVRYGEPVVQEYKDIWIIELDDAGRCNSFEEWPFWPPDREGGWRQGPPE